MSGQSDDDLTREVLLGLIDWLVRADWPTDDGDDAVLRELRKKAERIDRPRGTAKATEEGE